MRGLPRQDRRARLKKQVGRLRVVLWNVGTMTGKAIEIADALRRRKVDIACVQEVKWKGSKARNLGHCYKPFLSWRDEQYKWCMVNPTRRTNKGYPGDKPNKRQDNTT